MKIGLFFGSFNPVHVGHMIIANHMVQHTDIEAMWMVLSPHNPLKKKKTLANDYDRLHLLNLAIGEHTSIKASSVEFGLPQPSYTIDTMMHLEEKYPEHTFSLIMGGDNLATFERWKQYERLLEKYTIYVYSRPNQGETPLADHPHVFVVEAPLLNISSSYIRAQIKDGKSIQYLVPDKVYAYLLENPIYDRLNIQ